MTTEREVMLLALDKAKDLEEMLERFAKREGDAERRIEELEMRLRQAHQATQPTNARDSVGGPENMEGGTRGWNTKFPEANPLLQDVPMRPITCPRCGCSHKIPA